MKQEAVSIAATTSQDGNIYLISIKQFPKLFKYDFIPHHNIRLWIFLSSFALMLNLAISNIMSSVMSWLASTGRASCGAITCMSAVQPNWSKMHYNCTDSFHQISKQTRSLLIFYSNVCILAWKKLFKQCDRFSNHCKKNFTAPWRMIFTALWALQRCCWHSAAPHT